MNTRAIPNSQLELIEIIEGTPGGKTYIFYDKKHKRKLYKCNRKTSTEDAKEDKCNKYAGWRTDHTGTGACYLHGGTAGRKATIADRRQSFMARYRLQDKIDVLLQDTEALLDLSTELAAAKAIAQELIETFPEREDDHFTIHLARFTNVLKTLANVTDKISLIQSRQALTAAQVMYVRAAIVDVFVKHIKDPTEREHAVKDLVFRLGGTDENFQVGQTLYREMKDSGISVNLLGQ